MLKSKVAINCYIFIVGFLGGAVSFGILAFYTNDVYLHMIRTSFRAEQLILAAKATDERDIVRLLTHRWNIVDSSSENWFPVSDKIHAENNFWKPFELIILKNVLNSMQTPLETKKTEGIARGKLAYALELAGMEQQAEKQWVLGCDLANYKKEEKFKEFIFSLE